MAPGHSIKILLTHLVVAATLTGCAPFGKVTCLGSGSPDDVTARPAYLAAHTRHIDEWYDSLLNTVPAIVPYDLDNDCIASTTGVGKPEPRIYLDLAQFLHVFRDISEEERQLFMLFILYHEVAHLQGYTSERSANEFAAANFPRDLGLEGRAVLERLGRVAPRYLRASRRSAGM